MLGSSVIEVVCIVGIAVEWMCEWGIAEVEGVNIGGILTYVPSAQL